MTIDREAIMKRISGFHEAVTKVGNLHNLEDFILKLADERLMEIVEEEMKRRGMLPEEEELVPREEEKG